MNLIHKQSFDISRLYPDTLELSVPKGSQIISVANQYNRITVYYMFDTEPSVEAEKLIIYIIPTGAEFELTTSYKFLGTILLYDGTLVFHLFQIDL